MKKIKLKDNCQSYILYLQRGEKVNAGIENFCKEQNIVCASFTGIGAISNVEVAQYQFDKKEYHQKTFPGNYELISLVGNFGYIRNNNDEDKCFAHTHVSFTDLDYKCWGGHLIETEVCAVVEIRITAYQNKLFRSFDENIGLNTLDASNDDCCDSQKYHYNSSHSNSCCCNSHSCSCNSRCSCNSCCCSCCSRNSCCCSCNSCCCSCCSCNSSRSNNSHCHNSGFHGQHIIRCTCQDSEDDDCKDK